MNCRQCGCKIPDRLLRQDAFRCPQCGKPYRKRPQTTQPVKTNKPRTERPLEKKRLLIFGGGVLIFLTILITTIALVNRPEPDNTEEMNARLHEIAVELTATKTPEEKSDQLREMAEMMTVGNSQEDTPIPSDSTATFDFSIEQYIQALNVHMYLFKDSGIMADGGSDVDEAGHTVGLLTMDDNIAGTYRTVNGKVEYINIIGSVPNLADDNIIHVLTVFMSSMLAVEGTDAAPEGLGDTIWNALKQGLDSGGSIVELQRNGYKATITYSVLIGEMITITPN